MHFQSDNIYHLYNRGINKKKIFHSSRNYILFLEKIKKYLYPHCYILAYCLMPNHFHLMIYVDKNAEPAVLETALSQSNVISEGIRLILSSYAKAINKQENRTGNLFQQNTKCKVLTIRKEYLGALYESIYGYADVCFDYIHFNPVKAQLVSNPAKWQYSSYNEYVSEVQYTLCNIEIAKQLLDITMCHTYRCGTLK